MTRYVVLSIVAFVALLSSAAPAFAHECFNASRSDKGNAGAGGSHAWFTLSIADILGGCISDEEGECILVEGEPVFAFEGAALDQALEDAAGAGVPESVTIHTTSLAAKGVDDTYHTGDGKGIDHLFDAEWIGALIGIYCSSPTAQQYDPICSAG